LLFLSTEKAVVADLMYQRGPHELRAKAASADRRVFA
jgi:hypothetical protein